MAIRCHRNLGRESVVAHSLFIFGPLTFLEVISLDAEFEPAGASDPPL
jgi:hypothetical protein